jgi:hypothetical protein
MVLGQIVNGMSFCCQLERSYKSQRVELQRTFFPSPYRDITPNARLKPGDRRVWQSMKVFVELRESTTLQIPFREASKVGEHLSSLPHFSVLSHLGLAMGWSDRISKTAETRCGIHVFEGG